MYTARVLQRYRRVHPRALRTAPLPLTEVANRGGGEEGPIVFQSLDEVARVASNQTLSARQLWNSSRVIRESRHVRESNGACVVGGADAIQRIWRDYKIRPNVVYVPDTEPEVAAWCLGEELPTCVVRCPPVDINKQLLSADRGDGYAAEFPVPISPKIDAFLGGEKSTRFASMLSLMGLRIPSNVGLLIRAAVDMGFESVLLDDCVDIFNEKVLRASGGAVFSPSIKLFETNGAPASLFSAIALEHRLLPLLAVPSQKAESAFVVAKRLHEANSNQGGNDWGPLLVLGSESKGLDNTPLFREEEEWPLSRQFVSIPLANPAVNSINVAVAGSVLLHAFRPAAAKHFSQLNGPSARASEGLQIASPKASFFEKR